MIQKWIIAILYKFCAKFIIMCPLCDLSGGKDIILLMKSNSNWFFQSPFPKAISFYNPQPIRPEQDNQPDQSQWNKPYISPEIIPTNFRPASNLNQLSPWTKNIHSEHDYKPYSLAVEGLVPEGSQNHEGINEPLVYSDNEYQEPITPMRNQERGKEKVEEGQLHTTGRKSELQQTAKRSRPREKGLRKLSQRAFEIVQEMKNATYKEVAAKLVQELNEEEFEGENKQEQNIKRRVYDALNVLIALGVLKKDGRRIVSDRGSKKGRRSQLFEPEEIQALKSKLLAKEAAVEQKKKKLREAQDKFKCITTLLHRNKEVTFSMESVIPFPFIGIILKDSDAEKVQSQHTAEFFIKSEEPMQPFGDIDSLKWLGQSLEKLSLNDERSADRFVIREQQDEIS